MGEEKLHQLIKGCIKQDMRCHKKLYKAFYGFSMGICLRYTSNRDEATEVMNQGFFKVFTQIGSYDIRMPFKGWLGKIMRNVSIDFYRAKLKIAYTEDMEKADYVSDGDAVDSNLNYNDLLAMVQQLPDTYRIAFNLFAIDGYSHNEIASMLNISPDASKSNLQRARHRLKLMIAKAEQSVNYNYRNNVSLKIK
jgi:RNA polymerase sigma factor (sigma-70 family)